MLVGNLTDTDNKVRSIVAVYETANAAPCCGWRVVERDSDTAKRLFDKVKWLKPADMPKLGELPFASIERAEYIGVGEFSSAFGNPKIAMICTLR